MYATDLTCVRCGRHQDLKPDTYLCDVCGKGEDPTDAGVLDVQYDYEAIGQSLFKGRTLTTTDQDMFRFLPPPAPRETRAGATDRLDAPLPGTRPGELIRSESLYLKDETRNPTRALKDRATAVGVSRPERWVTAILLRFFGQRRDLNVRLLRLSQVSRRTRSCLAGLAAPAQVAAALRRRGPALRWRLRRRLRGSRGSSASAWWYSRNCAFNPFLVEGKKTVGLRSPSSSTGRFPTS